MPVPTHDYWYESTFQDDSLRQGDIFRDLVVLWWPQDLPDLTSIPQDGDLPVKPQWDRGDWIIMSASCDVFSKSDRYPHVVLARVLPATPKNFGVAPGKEYEKRLEVVRKNLELSKFLLAACPTVTPPFPQSIVTYRVHVTMPADYLRRSCLGRRLRMRHPFREQFGTWAAGNLGRVGPENETLIPSSGVKTWPDDVLRAND